MSSLNPGAASFNVNSQTLQFQMTLDPASNPVVAGDVVQLLINGNVSRIDNGACLPAIFDTGAFSAPTTASYIAIAPLSTNTFAVVYRISLKVDFYTR